MAVRLHKLVGVPRRGGCGRDLNIMQGLVGMPLLSSLCNIWIIPSLAVYLYWSSPSNAIHHFFDTPHHCMKTHTWTLDQRAVVTMLHTLAIVTGVFRSFYRLYISRFWWEDVWAMIALLLDTVCLVCVWMPRNLIIATLWMEAIVLASGLWAARMSMITTIIRITNHHVFLKRSAYATAAAFSMMWITTIVQRLYNCISTTCHLKQETVTTQLVTDFISDALLLILPLCFLRGVKIERGQRVLLVSSFGSSICITIISIIHSVFLLRPFSVTSVIIGNAKTALAVIICNLLVIVTFIYRLCHRKDVDLDAIPRERSDGAQFTSIIPEQWNLSGALRSTPSPGISSHQPPSTLDVDAP